MEQKFLNDLYSVLSTHTESVNKLTIRIKINPDHAIFKGHFPGNPILPGVCILQIIKELLSLHRGTELNLKRAGTIKYLSFINPSVNNLIDIDLEIRDCDNVNLTCNSTIHSGSTLFCSFRGEFQS